MSARKMRRSCFEDAPCSMTFVRFFILMMMEAMEEERTASSSRRSAKLRERSRGRESRVWLYSARRARV